MNKLHLPITIRISLLLVMFSTVNQAQEKLLDELEISISSGVLLPGFIQGSYELNFPADETVDIKNKVCPLVKFVADYPVTDRLSGGININYAAFTIGDILFKGESFKMGNEVNLGYWDGTPHVIPLEDIQMLEINGSIKGRYVLNEKMILKSCIYIGFRKTFSSSQWAEQKGVVLNLNAEFQYFLNEKYFLLADLGIFTQPFGGVKHLAYVRSFGVPYLSLGIGYKL